jgi:IclR family transcriptional regulator, KDG regulon repressor
MLERGESALVERGSNVQSLVRAFGLLEKVVSREGGIGLADLAKSANLHNSTTFHLVRTLVELGYLRQAPDTKRYHAGHMLFSVAAGALTEIELVATAGPFLEELVRETGESVYLATRSGDEVMIVAVVPGSGAIQLRGRAGTLRPPHATALGKVLLAALPAAHLSLLLERLPLSALTENTITDRGLLLHELERVRESGMAFDDGEFDAEIRCMAVPVYNFVGQVAAAIGISGPAWRLKLQVVGEKASQLRIVARKLSEALGGGQYLARRKNEGQV